MERRPVVFEDDDLRDLYTKKTSSGRYSQAIEKAFRKRISFIRNAVDERDLYAWKSLHFEQLENRGEQRSVRLNDQWRLILEFVKDGMETTVKVIAIEDYH